MVDHVQGRQVRELLSGQEEEGVEEVDELREEVPPGHVGSIEAVLGVAVVHGLTQPVVLPREPEPARLLEYPDTQQRLEEVVDHHHPLYVEWLPVLHEPGPGHSDDVVVEEAEDHRWPGGGHQEPVVHPAK